MLTKELLISNFKSIAGEISLGPFDSFVVISGENGGGKSNIFDALAFVLGDIIRNLRVTYLQDLVNNENRTRPCFVSLTLDVSKKANSDATVKVFKREILNQKSIYTVDDRSVTKEMYLQELSTVACSALNQHLVIRQDLLLRVANSSQEKLFKFVEAFAGLEQTSEEVQSKSVELKRLNADLQKSQTKLLNAKKKLGVLKNKLADLKKHQKHLQERTELTKKLFLTKLFAIYQGRDRTNQAKAELEREELEREEFEIKKAAVNQQLEDIEKEKNALKQEMSDHRKEIEALKENRESKNEQIRESKEQIREFKLNLDMLKGGINLKERQLEEERARWQTFEPQIAQLKQQMAELTTEIETKTQEIQDREPLDPNSELVAEFQRLDLGAKSQIGQNNDELVQLEQQLEALKMLLDSKTEMLNSLLSTMKFYKKEIDESKQKLKDHETAREIFLKDVEQCTQESESKQELLNKTKEKIRKRRDDLKDVQAGLSTAKLAYRKVKSKDFTKQLKENFPGVFGRVETLVTFANSRYRLVFQRVLGSKLSTILVDQMSTATDCIKYMTDNKIKAEYFVALKETKNTKSLEQLRSHCTESIKLFLDCLRFKTENAKLKQAILYIAGQTFVCETREEAMAINQLKYNAVTLEGTFYSKNGDITGGSFDLEKMAAAFDERELEFYQQQRNSFQDVLKKLYTLEDELKLEILAIKDRCNHSGFKLRMRNAQISILENKIQERQQKLEELTTKFNDWTSEIESLNAEIGEKQKSLSELEAKLSLAKEEVFRPFCEKFNLSNLQEYEKRTRAGIQASKEKLVDLHLKHASLEAELNLLNARLGEKNPMLETDLESLREELAKLEQELMAKMDKLNELQEELKQIDQQHAQLVQQIKEKKQRLIELKKEEDAKLDEKRIYENRKEENELSAGLIEKEKKLLLNCALDDEIELPMKKNQKFLEIYREDDDLDEAEFDYRMIKKDLANVGDNIELLKQKLTKSLNKNRIAIGMNIDLNAANEELETKERIKRIEREVIEKKNLCTRNELELINMRNSREQKLEHFIQELIVKVNHNYKSLYQNQAASVLIAHDFNHLNDTGKLVFGSIIPGKRARNLDELSSGEKSLAAMALCCALNTSPILLLDEFDAYLDATNCVKVCSFLENLKPQYDHIIVISHKGTVDQVASDMITVFKKNGQTNVLSISLAGFL